MSPTFMGLLFGGMALFVLWALVRAVRTGRISSDTRTYDADADPGMFASMVAGQAAILVLCIGEVGHSLGLCPSPFGMIKAWLGPLG